MRAKYEIKTSIKNPRYRKRAEVTVLTCEQKPYWSGLVVAKAIQYSVNKAWVTLAWVSGLPKGMGERRFLMGEGGGGRRERKGWMVPVKASVSGVSLLQLSPFFASIFPLFPQKRLILRLEWHRIIFIIPLRPHAVCKRPPYYPCLPLS